MGVQEFQMSRDRLRFEWHESICNTKSDKDNPIIFQAN